MKHSGKNLLLSAQIKKHTKLDENLLDAKSHILNKDTDFNTMETYRSIRTSIIFSMPKTNDGKAIVVTSSVPGEGKTTTCINLAITFAQMGAKVIIVDCDLRKSRVHRYLGITRKGGVTNYLCGLNDLDEIIKHTDAENLDVITAGDIPPNPAELISSDSFAEMIYDLKTRYDYVFIDTPPLNIVTDGIVAMKYCSGVVVVVRLGLTTYDMLDCAIADIKLSESNILGTIVVGAEEFEKKYGYYGKKGYYGKYNKYSYRYNYRYKYDYTDNNPNAPGNTDKNV